MNLSNIENIELSSDDIISMLTIENPDEISQLFDIAYAVKLKHVGNKVFFRGLIELSNICEKDCLYCGIRKSNPDPERYLMKEDEILRMSIWCYNAGYGSIVLQAGEISGENFTAFIENVIKSIKAETNGGLGITLSLGEQNDSAYERWFNAGAHRYLLRIETSNPILYSKIHPDNHSYERRISCLETIRKIGYYTGTGVMIGLPGQSIEDLARDIIFFKEIDADMIGMGPYIPHKDTPMGVHSSVGFNTFAAKQLALALRMIAVTRIYLKDVNIAATTALQALDENGREKGLKAGANIIMPNITDIKYRRGYQLYDNKPCLDENASMCKDCLEFRINSIGETIGYSEWGDSPHHKGQEQKLFKKFCS